MPAQARGVEVGGVREGQELRGRYRLVEPLGRGGMGEVWRVLDLRLDREVAVKMMRTNWADEDALTRFRREGKAAARLNHPHIAALYDVGDDQGQPFLVLELLPGPNLAAVLNRHPDGLPVADVLKYGAQAAEGLSAAHAAGIIHRDVKPSNLMFGRDGRLKVCDFGIARMIDSTRMTMKGAIGTPRYMAPEQFKGDEIDQRADLYSLGCVLFEMLVGRAPFSGETPHALLYQHLNEPPPRPRVSRPDVPAELEELLMGLLAKQASERPTSADQVGGRLTAIAANVTLHDAHAQAERIVEEAQANATELHKRAHQEIDALRRADAERHVRAREAAEKVMADAEQQESQARQKAAALIGEARREAERIIEQAQREAATATAQRTRSAGTERKAPRQPGRLLIAATEDMSMADEKKSRPQLLVRKVPPTSQDLERWADSVDRLDPPDAARRLSSLAQEWQSVEPALIEKILDLLGTRKARLIRANLPQ